MPVRTVIVDDEQPICDEIEYLLKSESDIQVAAKFTNALEASQYLKANECDLIFLDIKMPGVSGLSMAQTLSLLHRPPLIVFITAYPDHALEAFDTPAVGYITKPVTDTKLAKVLDKIRALQLRPATPKSGQANKICVMNGSKIIPLNKQDIVFIYVRDKDVFVRTANQEFAAPLTLQELEQLVSGQNFLRVHRQYLVNLDKIQEILPWFHGSYLLRMGDDQAAEVPVSRTKVKTFKAMMGLR